MRHHNKNKKFSRKRKVRNALLRSLAVALISKEKITTTESKAKSLRSIVEKLVTHGKEKTLASQRLLVSKVGSTSAKKLIAVLGPKYKDRKGGYTRITKVGRRQSDRTAMSQIEFV